MKGEEGLGDGAWLALVCAATWAVRLRGLCGCRAAVWLCGCCEAVWLYGLAVGDRVGGDQPR